MTSDVVIENGTARVKGSPGAVVKYVRDGDDLLIHHANGKVSRVPDFFSGDDARLQLVLAEDGREWPATAVKATIPLKDEETDEEVLFRFEEDDVAGGAGGSLAALAGLFGLGGAAAAIGSGDGGGGPNRKPPAKPAFVGEDDQGATQGMIATGGLTDDAKPEFSGKGEPGNVITITDNGIVLGMTTVDASGNWSFTPPDALEDGGHSVTVTETDKAGNATTSDPLDFTVDTAAPAGLDAPVVPEMTGGVINVAEASDGTPVEIPAYANMAEGDTI
ncbi:hypothetical protein BTE77_35755, partial [Ensifer adhaerens]